MIWNTIPYGALMLIRSVYQLDVLVVWKSLPDMSTLCYAGSTFDYEENARLSCFNANYRILKGPCTVHIAR
jgi:hypothetical protein